MASPGGGGRLSVRKDLFPPPGPAPDATTLAEDPTLGVISCVKLETDFERSIDEIALGRAPPNGLRPASPGPSESDRRRRSGKRRKRKRRNSTSDDDSDSNTPLENGRKPPDTKRRKSRKESRTSSNVTFKHKVKGGKNLNLVSSSKCEEDATDSDDELVLKCASSPLIAAPRGGGKPYSHRLSQLSSRKRKRKTSERRQVHVVTPSSGKPRSMMGICSSRSKKSSGSKKSERTPTYHSQIVDTDTIKIKIRKANVPPQDVPGSIENIGQRKSKKNKVSTPLVSASSGEEYDPSRGETAASVSVAAPKSRNSSMRARKEPFVKKKDKSDTTKANKSEVQVSRGPQSVWGSEIPIPVLTQIFEYVLAAQGTLPTAIKLGRVCQLWHSVSCQPVLWRHVELATYTCDKWKTDFKLISLLEHRLTMCNTLNLAHWKVSNLPWVIACLIDYCPGLVELNLTGWSRLTPEHLRDLVQGLPKLRRLDLSLIAETGGSGSCLSATSMAHVTEAMGQRLTHLSLANNMFTALQQILTSIATHCCNLEVLDISGAKATSHPALIPLEALQKGCPKLRVLRIANSQVVLASSTTSQQMEASGFPNLEELSIAAETSGSGVGEYRLDDEALERIVRGATRLKLLDLRGLIRISDSGLVRVPAWDLQHLFLGMCNVTRQSSSCLELVCEKWAHSLLEVDLAWASATRPLDSAVEALADKGAQSKLRILNLCGSSVSLEPVKKVLLKCPQLESINLSSCRALPRGMKRLYMGKELQDLKDSLDPVKVKAKEEAEQAEKERKKKEKEAKKKDSKIEPKSETVPEQESDSSQAIIDPNETSTSTDTSQAQKIVTEISSNIETELKILENKTDKEYYTTGLPTAKTKSPISKTDSPISKTESPVSKTEPLVSKTGSPTPKTESSMPKEPIDSQSSAQTSSTPKATSKNWNLEQFSPCIQSNADSSSSTPMHEHKSTPNSVPQASPMHQPDSQHTHTSPDMQQDSQKANSSWNLDQFKTTASNSVSEASPLISHTKTKQQTIEQYSPVTSQDCKPSPEGMHNVKQDLNNPNHWNYGNYSPMTRQEPPYSGQPSPYSAQPSPAQPSPYSTQPSPYSTQPSPYSSQQSPYSAQPSPDTSQIIKTDLQKPSSNWNIGGFSPMTKQSTQYSPHPSTHTSPDPGAGVKSDTIRTNSGKAGQFSPMSRQDRHHKSPYSPRPSMESPAGIYPNRKSPGMGNYSPMMRNDCHNPSPDAALSSRASIVARQVDPFVRATSSVPAAPEPPPILTSADLAALWSLERFSTGSGARSPVSDSGVAWATPNFPSALPSARSLVDNIPRIPNTLPSQVWSVIPPYDSGVSDVREEIPDQWTMVRGFSVEPPPVIQNTFLEQSVTFDSLGTLGGHSAHTGHQAFVDENFAESSRVD